MGKSNQLHQCSHYVLLLPSTNSKHNQTHAHRKPSDYNTNLYPKKANNPDTTQTFKTRDGISNATTRGRRSGQTKQRTRAASLQPVGQLIPFQLFPQVDSQAVGLRLEQPQRTALADTGGAARFDAAGAA